MDGLSQMSSLRFVFSHECTNDLRLRSGLATDYTNCTDYSLRSFGKPLVDIKILGKGSVLHIPLWLSRVLLYEIQAFGFLDLFGV